jgi:hypothetical protein
MLDDTATVGDLAPGAVGTTLSPHLIAALTDALACGQMLDFQVDVVSAEGSWPATFQQIVGEVVAERSGVTLSEDFLGGIPATWTVVDGETSGSTWFADSAADPAGCASADPQAPFAGGWAAVDSICAGGGAKMDEELITPVMDFTGDPIVTLEFDHWFAWEPGRRDEVADVDVRSSLTGGTWVNAGRWTGASTANPEHETIDISTWAADAPDVQVRFHYYNAQSELYWYVDNVVVHYLDPEDCLNAACLAPVSSPPPVPAGAFGTQALLADRLTADGSQISVLWDDQCGPANANILYGSLDQVASHTPSGAVCSIANPETWAGVPAGDLWFLVVSDDGAGVESSWGSATDGERNGLIDSGTCGNVATDIEGVCP